MQTFYAYVCHAKGKVGHQARFIGARVAYSPPYDLMHAMHEILDASNSVQPFQRNFVTWQDYLGSSASRGCGS